MSTPTQFLVHERGDDVGVAVVDVVPGRASLGYLDGTDDETIVVSERIPLGHKVALVDLAEDHPVVEYGMRVGIARAAIAAGQLVHTHNLRSARWQTSVA